MVTPGSGVRIGIPPPVSTGWDGIVPTKMKPAEYPHETSFATSWATAWEWGCAVALLVLLSSSRSNTPGSLLSLVLIAALPFMAQLASLSALGRGLPRPIRTLVSLVAWVLGLLAASLFAPALVLMNEPGVMADILLLPGHAGVLALATSLRRTRRRSAVIVGAGAMVFAAAATLVYLNMSGVSTHLPAAASTCLAATVPPLLLIE